MPAIRCLTSIGFLLALHLKPIELRTPPRQGVGTGRGPLLSPSDLRIGLGGAWLMVIATR